MSYATTMRIAARVAMGISDAHRAATRVMSSSVTAWIIPATGVRPPLRTFVAVRAIAPVAGMPPKKGVIRLAVP
ncbi:hypothetical protein D3C83_197650 [compost metagenome]